MLATTDDIVIPDSPTIARGLLTYNDAYPEQSIPKYSPIDRSLSDIVAPVDVFDQSRTKFADFNNEQYGNSTDAQSFCDQLFQSCFVNDDAFATTDDAYYFNQYDDFLMLDEAFF
jgi:hypothetical protein